MTPAQLKAKIESLAPGTKAKVIDMTGTQDHYEAFIVSPAFRGKMMIEQHRLVLELMDADIQSGEVHALTMKTYTPEKAPADLI
ncbi:MAG: BolA/IbaG family iron-sulfur metabolism protein [Bdellovibrionota bacterium]